MLHSVSLITAINKTETKKTKGWRGENKDKKESNGNREFRLENKKGEKEGGGGILRVKRGGKVNVEK